ncbi:MAG TPA: hypothetical protein VJV40_06035, partial [Thermodesulfobacteriota bacterium]|nr:hypothetical protein [Thermodesulfobacteriota bacterium]
NTLRALTIALAIALLHTAYIPAASNAEDASAAPPDLRGIWKGTAEVYYPDTTKKLTTELRVTEQDGWYIKGVRHWKLLDASGKPLGYVMDKPVNEADEPFLGVIGFDGKKINFVEVGDWGSMKGNLVGGNQIELIYTESGDHPLVFRTVLTKE